MLQNPFDEDRRIGTVVKAEPTAVLITLASAASAHRTVLHGDWVGRGEVGEYVCMPRAAVVAVGRLVEVVLPERERVRLRASQGATDPPQALGVVMLLCEVDIPHRSVTNPAGRAPRLGAPAYAAPPDLIRWAVEQQRPLDPRPSARLRIGHLPDAQNATIDVPAQSVLGRHCAVLGVTGAGKSWTVARLVEECHRARIRAILVDATGEFHTLSGERVQHVSIGREVDLPASTEDVAYPYQDLDERDLLALFRPSPQVQAPTLQQALKSLRLVIRLPQGHVLRHSSGCLVKAGKSRKAFSDAMDEHRAVVEAPRAPFDITRLPDQLGCECIYPSSNQNDDQFGPKDDRQLGFVFSLRMRVETALSAVEYAPLLAAGNRRGLREIVDEFLKRSDEPLLRVSLRHLPFINDIRPIVANAIGRLLLDYAYRGTFREQPLLVVLDEAHQFATRRVGDDALAYELDAFELIAKEGRKYGLTLCLATQRPRDLQETVLSQVGTLIVHRLSHPADREVVERSLRDIDASAAGFITTLGTGEAMLLGADFPFAVPVKIHAPGAEPESKGPVFGAQASSPTPANLAGEGSSAHGD